MAQSYDIGHWLLLDKVLVKAIQAGGEVCEAAWAYIFQHWKGYFITTIRRKGAAEVDALDFVSEVFEPVERALRNGRFRHEAPLRTYINRAVLYRWYAHLRRQKKLLEAERAEAERLEQEFEPVFRDDPGQARIALFAPATEMPDVECIELALAALKQAEPLKHRMFKEFSIERKKQSDIAKRHQKGKQTVKNYVRDAKAFLRNWFEQNPDCPD